MTKMVTVVAEVDKKKSPLPNFVRQFEGLNLGHLDDKLMLVSRSASHVPIQEAAKRLIERDDYQADGSILIQAADLY